MIQWGLWLFDPEFQSSPGWYAGSYQAAGIVFRARHRFQSSPGWYAGSYCLYPPR